MCRTDAFGVTRLNREPRMQKIPCDTPSASYSSTNGALNVTFQRLATTTENKTPENHGILRLAHTPQCVLKFFAVGAQETPLLTSNQPLLSGACSSCGCRARWHCDISAPRKLVRIFLCFWSVFVFCAFGGVGWCCPTVVGSDGT